MLVGVLTQNVVINTGRFGGSCLLPGIYFYCGSALGPGGLLARIYRHIRLGKNQHWHFDFIRPYLEITRVWWADSNVSECDLCRWIAKVTPASFPLAGFGSSDCTRSCRSHLILVPSDTNLESLEFILGCKASGFNGMIMEGNLIESISSLPGEDKIEKKPE